MIQDSREAYEAELDKWKASFVEWSEHPFTSEFLVHIQMASRKARTDELRSCRTPEEMWRAQGKADALEEVLASPLEVMTLLRERILAREFADDVVKRVLREEFEREEERVRDAIVSAAGDSKVNEEGGDPGRVKRGRGRGAAWARRAILSDIAQPAMRGVSGEGVSLRGRLHQGQGGESGGEQVSGAHEQEP